MGTETDKKYILLLVLSTVDLFIVIVGQAGIGMTMRDIGEWFVRVKLR